VGKGLIFTGIDASSKAVHVTLVNDDGSVAFCLKFDGGKGKKAEDRFPSLAKSLAALPGAIEGSDYVAIERPLYFKSPTATITISMVIGAVCEVLELAGIEYHMVENTVWKKATVGRGNADKPSIMKYAEEVSGDKFEEQDWADAYCIALWSMQRWLKDPDH
jgi:Holliday junction resolvasome RuvABC endonuclease subunit